MQVRVDKYMWAVRIFKTRSIAAHACDLEKVQVNEQVVRASRTVKPGDTISIRIGPFERKFRVEQLVQQRQPARMVPDFCSDITSPEMIARMKAHAAARAAWRKPGMGRPTKKERRDLDDFMTFDDW